MANVPTITLNNGIKMPAFGLGTYMVMYSFSNEICLFSIRIKKDEKNYRLVSNQNKISNFAHSLKVAKELRRSKKPLISVIVTLTRHFYIIMNKKSVKLFVIKLQKVLSHVRMCLLHQRFV